MDNGKKLMRAVLLTALAVFACTDDDILSPDKPTTGVLLIVANLEKPTETKRPPMIASGLSCALCRFPVEEKGFEIIQDRGPLCLACLEAIRS